MRHADDGTLHAWLDRQVTDPAEAAWVETHLRDCPDCSARLADEGATLEQAEALLASVAPAVDPSRQAFDALVARTKNAASSSGSGTATSHSAFRTWVVPASWAASIALAAVIGWTVRDRAPVAGDDAGGDVRSSSQAVASAPLAQGTTASPDGTSADSVRMASRAARADGAASTLEKEAASVAAEGAAVRRSERTQAAAPPPLTAERARAEPAPGDAVASGGAAVATAPPAAAEQRADAASTPAAGTLPRAPASLPSLPVQSLLQPALPLEPVRVLAGRETPAAVAAVTGPQGRLVPAQAGGGGGGGLAGGARGAAVAARAGVSERTAGNSAEWVPVFSRTEAAVKSGMPLYGINGVTPMATLLSPDGVAVRTVYRLDSGETLELTQQRTTNLENRFGAARAAPVAETQVADVQNARVAAPLEPWTIVRGDVRLTLRGVANPAAVAERLRLD